ncbi:MAG: DUF1669 domain-containing protein [Lentisphaeria bacterium]|nr:DUF1669 domain-containing protein [Lentisphaeria bacterium]
MAKASQKTSKKTSGGSTASAAKGFRFFSKWKFWSLLTILILLGLGTAFSYVPEEDVPGFLEQVHAFCLRNRNNLILKTGLDLHRYDEAVTVRTTGSPDIAVYFAPGKQITKGLCQFIDSAKQTLDVCIYDLDLPEVTEALVNAKNRGVSVRVVTDSDNRKLKAIDRLEKAGIWVVADERSTIMHNKFVVLDGQKVWTGSFNFTENGKIRNDNNALILDSRGIAAFYKEKFKEYMSGNFSKTAVIKTKEFGKTSLGKMPVQVAFSPSDGVADIICAQLSDAKACVYVMAFVLTSEKIAQKLGELAKNGVEVHCVLDRGQARTRYSQSQYLLSCGVKMDISPNSKGKMHHKVITIDEDTVITGSYNFSDNAEKGNDENIIIIRNVELAKLYNKEFKRCLNGTKGY